jgi:hypothetical protein
MVVDGKFNTKRRRWHGERQMPPMRGGGERISSIVEMSRNAEEEKGDPEQQMTTHKRGNNTGEATVNIAERVKFSTLTYKIKCKWEN